MRRTLLNLSLAALAVATPLAAHAASFDQLTITNGTTTFGYTLPAAPTTFTTPTSGGAAAFEGDYFELDGVASTATGTPGTTLDNLVFFNALSGTGFTDITSGNTFIGPVFFTSLLSGGVLINPSFVVESGSLIDGNNVRYSFTVTPEPSSLMLLGTGAIGLCGAMRRKLFA